VCIDEAIMKCACRMCVCVCIVVESFCWAMQWKICRLAVSGKEIISSPSLCLASSTTWTSPAADCLALSKFDALTHYLSLSVSLHCSHLSLFADSDFVVSSDAFILLFLSNIFELC